MPSLIIDDFVSKLASSGLNDILEAAVDPQM